MVDGRNVQRGSDQYPKTDPYTSSAGPTTPFRTPRLRRVGVASWYGDDFHGKKNRQRRHLRHVLISRPQDLPLHRVRVVNRTTAARWTSWSTTAGPSWTAGSSTCPTAGPRAGSAARASPRSGSRPWAAIGPVSYLAQPPSADGPGPTPRTSSTPSGSAPDAGPAQHSEGYYTRWHFSVRENPTTCATVMAKSGYPGTAWPHRARRPPALHGPGRGLPDQEQAARPRRLRAEFPSSFIDSDCRKDQAAGSGPDGARPWPRLADARLRASAQVGHEFPAPRSPRLQPDGHVQPGRALFSWPSRAPAICSPGKAGEDLLHPLAQQASIARAGPG
jgi:hypothetical protein